VLVGPAYQGLLFVCVIRESLLTLQPQVGLLYQPIVDGWVERCDRIGH
jgi:hypothetical protein